MPKARETLPYAFLPALPRQGRGGTTQRVHEVIRQAVIALSFTPGEFIRKDAVCRRLGVSRFPLSEALGRLATEGFVEILPQRGTRVTPLDIAACRQAMFIRQALEGETIRVIATRNDDGLVARLDASLQQQKRAVEQADGKRFFEYDLAFHEILLSALGYERVKSAVDAARGSLDRTRLFLLRTPQRQAESYLEHAAIVDALRARDPVAAQDAMKRHLDKSMAEIESRAAANPEIFTEAAGPG